jgi:hypothetical protein
VGDSSTEVSDARKEQTVKISAAFPSKYLRAADLPDGRFVPVTIDHVEMEVIGSDSDDSRPIVYFAGKAKGLVLNKTNASTIAARYGDDTETWSGKSILLYGTETLFQGKNTPCIRVKIPAESAVQRQAKPSPPAMESAPSGGRFVPEKLPEPASPISEKSEFASDDIPF